MEIHGVRCVEGRIQRVNVPLQLGPKKPFAHVSHAEPANWGGQMHVPKVVHVPADEQGALHDDDCNAARDADDAFANEDAAGN